ncbi:WS/DGAT domain-containing protein, partial [Ralstonia pseudosolanacearum]
MASYFTSKFLSVLGRLRGPEAAAEYIHSNLRNSSIMITNMVGPVEKASVGGRPLKSFYFTVPGVPQSLVFTIVSYMG